MTLYIDESHHLAERGEEASDHDILLSIAELLVELLAEAKRSNTLEKTGAVSSVEIHDLAPTKDRPNPEPSVTVKRYTGSEPEVEQTVANWAHAHGVISTATGSAELNRWVATVNALNGNEHAV